MKSQVKWGCALVAAGVAIALIGFPILLLYAVPLALI